MTTVVVQSEQQISVGLTNVTNTSVSLTTVRECTVELVEQNSGAQISLSMVPFIPAPKTQLFVQNETPEIPAGTSGLWVQTGLGDGSGFTFWIEDGQ